MIKKHLVFFLLTALPTQARDCYLRLAFDAKYRPERIKVEGKLQYVAVANIHGLDFPTQKDYPVELISDGLAPLRTTISPRAPLVGTYFTKAGYLLKHDPSPELLETVKDYDEPLFAYFHPKGASSDFTKMSVRDVEGKEWPIQEFYFSYMGRVFHRKVVNGEMIERTITDPIEKKKFGKNFYMIVQDPRTGKSHRIEQYEARNLDWQKEPFYKVDGKGYEKLPHETKVVTLDLGEGRTHTIQVEGPEYVFQSQLLVDTLKQALTKVPTNALPFLNSIQITEGTNASTIGYFGRGIKLAAKQISERKPEETRIIVLHELGHLISKKLSLVGSLKMGSWRKRWRAVRNQEQGSPHSDLGIYPVLHFDEEDFVHSMAEYFDNPQEFAKRFPLRADFLKILDHDNGQVMRDIYLANKVRQALALSLGVGAAYWMLDDDDETPAE